MMTGGVDLNALVAHAVMAADDGGAVNSSAVATPSVTDRFTSSMLDHAPLWRRTASVMALGQAQTRYDRLHPQERADRHSEDQAGAQQRQERTRFAVRQHHRQHHAEHGR